jgi:arylsulfatase A
MLFDDLGYGDVRCNNPDGHIATPHFDALAGRGMRFTDAHSSSSNCSPSRYALLTGRYHWRTRLQAGIVRPSSEGEPSLIAPGRITLGSVAKQAGYTTAFFGKTHIGGLGWPASTAERAALKVRPVNNTVTPSLRATWEAVFTRPIQHGPTSFGFDEFFGLDVNSGELLIENDHAAHPLPDHWTTPHDGHDFGPTPPDWDLQTLLPRLTQRATAFVRATRAKPKRPPFLLLFSSTSPHAPLAVSDEFRGTSNLSLYADWVGQSDAVVGTLLGAVQDAGVLSETLVIATSDNGQLGSRERTSLRGDTSGIEAMAKLGHHSNGALRGGKSDAFEGGHRVPFIVAWPGVVPAGVVSGALLHHVDVLATLADILRVALPDDAAEDSVSQLRVLLMGDRVPPVRTTSVSCSMRNVPTVRDGPWKLILGRGSGGWTLAKDSALPEALYNLERDPSEHVDVAANESVRVERMKRMLLDTIVLKGRSAPRRTPPVPKATAHAAEATTLRPVACRRPGQCVEWRRGVIHS